jgi:heme-degrading monooxygenase HmoA
MGMATIQAGAQPVTLINVFEVPPEKQGELVRVLEGAASEVMRRVPGFVSASVHKSLDGSRVVTYAQWASKEAFEQMPSFPGTREHMDRAAKLATRFTPTLYEVVSVVDASAASSAV